MSLITDPVRRKAIEAAITGPGGCDIADGTFMVVRQQWLLELTVYRFGPSSVNDTVWVVEEARIPRNKDTICNSSYATGDWPQEFTDELAIHFFDDSDSAHKYMAEFIINHQIDGV